LGNFVRATYVALSKTYSYLTPDQWAPSKLERLPYQVHTDFLKDAAKGKTYKKRGEE